MGFQVDFLPVEAGEKSGDAIAIKIGDAKGFWVIVIDGGYTPDGDALVDHINRHYGTNIVNLVVSTHPDADHAEGLVRVFERMEVWNLWMHRPWKHPDLAPLFRNDRVTTGTVQAKLKRDLAAARDVEKAALKKGVFIEEPFAGRWFGNIIRVFGPTLEFYRQQLAQFECLPEPRLRAVSPLVGIPPSLATLGALARRKQEDWHLETLDADCDTSAENNTSVIMGVALEPYYLGMFTGDAGEPALANALTFIEVAGIAKSNFKFVQIPHHGSEHNISPAVLNRWLGLPQAQDIQTRTAYVSSALKAPKHPSDKVMNAFRRRGALPFATEGKGLLHYSPVAVLLNRDRYSSAVPYPFYRGAA